MFAMNNHRAETCTVWSLFELNEVYSSQNVKQLLEVWSVEPLMFLSLKDGQRFYMLYYEVSTDFVDNLCGYRWYQFIWLFAFILGWHTACWLQVMLKITSQLHDDLCRHVVIRWHPFCDLWNVLASRQAVLAHLIICTDTRPAHLEHVLSALSCKSRTDWKLEVNWSMNEPLTCKDLVGKP